MKSNRIAESTLKKLEQIREEENYPDINELIDELLIIRNKIRLRSAQKFFREKLKESNFDISDFINDDDLKGISIKE
jgi:hypothetical protein